MRHLSWPLFLFVILFSSCGDGKISLSNFDFEGSTLETCENNNSRVFFKRNSNSPESLSLSIIKTDSIYYKTDTLYYQLDGGLSRLFYRLHDEPIKESYFCQAVPPTSPKTEQEYVSDSGTAIVYVLVKNSNEEEDKPLNTYPYTLTTQVSVVMKDISLYNGDETIIRETLPLGTITNILTRTITSPDQE